MLRHYLTYGDILGAIVPLLAFLGGIFWQKRRWIKENQKEIYEPIYIELFRIRENIKNNDPYSIRFETTQDILSNRILDSELRIKLNKIIRYSRAYSSTWHSARNIIQVSVEEYFIEANEGDETIDTEQYDDVAVSSLGGVQFWSINGPEFYLFPLEITDEEKEAFEGLDEKLVGLKPQNAEELYKELRSKILDIEEMSQIRNWIGPILNNYEKIFSEFESYYLRGAFGRIWNWIKLWQDFSLEEIDIPES